MVTVASSPSDLSAPVLPENFRRRAERPPIDRASAAWLILVGGDETPVGFCSLEVDPPHRSVAEPGTAWLSIVIGEERARGRGIGTATLRALEERAVQAGAERAEAGVFEFNAPALRMLRAAGYREVARLPAVTWWSDRFWSDVRLTRSLAST
jgi:RimJ/RimL family protein N-acetyltransferase